MCGNPEYSVCTASPLCAQGTTPSYVAPTQHCKTDGFVILFFEPPPAISSPPPLLPFPPPVTHLPQYFSTPKQRKIVYNREPKAVTSPHTVVKHTQTHTVLHTLSTIFPASITMAAPDLTILTCDVEEASWKAALTEVKAGNAYAVLALLQAPGVSAEERDRKAAEALHTAAASGQNGAIADLVASLKVPIDVVDTNECTALHHATYNNFLDAARYLPKSLVRL